MTFHKTLQERGPPWISVLFKKLVSKILTHSGSSTPSFYKLTVKPFLTMLIGTANGIALQVVGRASAWLHSVMDQNRCPFCRLEQYRILLENEFAAALHDGFPIADGHTLVVPKRHVAGLFDLSDEEQAAVWRLVAMVRAKLMAELKPDGFNIGVNDGTTAGQTILHAHVHVIPRRLGDSDDPRGGIRWILPKKAQYWVEGH